MISNAWSEYKVYFNVAISIPMINELEFFRYAISMYDCGSTKKCVSVNIDFALCPTVFFITHMYSFFSELLKKLFPEVFFEYICISVVGT